MEVRVKVTPNASKEGIKKLSDGRYSLFVTAKAENCSANDAACRMLATLFGIDVKRVLLIRGKTSHSKIFRIIEV